MHQIPHKLLEEEDIGATNFHIYILLLSIYITQQFHSYPCPRLFIAVQKKFKGGTLPLQTNYSKKYTLIWYEYKTTQQGMLGVMNLRFKVMVTSGGENMGIIWGTYD